MTVDQKASLVESGLILLVSVNLLLIGFRVIGKRPGKDLRYDDWHKKHGKWITLAGFVGVAYVGLRLLRLFSGE